MEGTIFATEAITIKSIGDNETKAYIDALKKIKTSDKSILAFVEKGKSKIIEYYNSKCDFINGVTCNDWRDTPRHLSRIRR